MIDRKNALKIWEEHYGKSVEATDFTGRRINKSAYDQKNSKFGWTVTLLLPRSAGGKEADVNLMCTHMDTAAEKAEEFPFFVANEKKYEILCDDDNEWVIEEAHDSESIAEQEARTVAALAKWDEIFGVGYEKAKDFCGRIIRKDEFCTESEFAWKIAPYVDSKPTEGKNAYIAHVLSVEEALGKTAFKANGKSYALNKDNGAYYFKAIETKPPKKAFDIANPYDLKKDMEAIISACSAGDNEMLDFIVIRAVSLPTCTAGMAQGMSKAVSRILSEATGAPLACEISEMRDEQGARYTFMTYRLAASGPADFERIFLAAQLLNTYAPLLTSGFGFSEFKIYNHALFVNRAHVSFPVGLLSGYYPEFKALMDSIYGSAYGYYEGEPLTTLFVSNFIVFNVASLSEMHPQGQTVYFTDLYMVEHNCVVPEVSEKLQKMLMGTPENEETVEPVTEETQSEEITAEAETRAEAESETPNEEPPATEEAEASAEEAPEAEEVAEEPEAEPLVAPAIEENSVNEENTPDEVAKETEVEVSIAPAIEETAEIQAVEDTEEELKVPAEAEGPEETVEEKTDDIPTGEQISLDISDENADGEKSDGENAADDASDDDSDDDGILTLDLDSLD